MGLRGREVDLSGLTGATETGFSSHHSSEEEITQSKNERKLICHGVNFNQ